MAKMIVTLPTEFQAQLENLEKIENYAPAMLEAAAPILTTSVKSTLQSVTSNEYSGDMIRSIKQTKASRFKNGGFFIMVRPTGKDKNGVRNMEKAMYKQFGTSKQAATPWLERSASNVETQIIDKMTEVFYREALKE